MLTRRQFLKLSAAAGASLFVPMKWAFDAPTASAFYQSTNLKMFAQQMRGVGPGGIPVAQPDANPAPVTGATHYSLKVTQYQDTLHPDLGGKTTLWGYSPAKALAEGAYPRRHLGGIIVAQKGKPVQITITNTLPNKHILPVDPSIMGVMGYQVNRVATHLHGGFVPWISDGGPFAWFDDAGHYGASVNSSAGNVYKLLNPGLQSGQAEYYYPNQQSARMMWYHDHAVGITRLNAYAGIASAYIIRDSFEASLVKDDGLPDFVEKGGRELPIVIQDKIFVGATADPNWSGVPTSGSLWYPHVYEDRWTRGPINTPLPDENNTSIPEMFGDTMLVNGTVCPETTVEARRYRLRILNACQARFLNLQLYVDDGSKDGITLYQPATGAYQFSQIPSNNKGPDFLVIGTEGGFLAHPVRVPSNLPMKYLQVTPTTPPNTIDPADPGGKLITAPAERWDIVVNFASFAGKNIILYNDAPAPFPGGDALNDYLPGNNGLSPNTRELMRFKVIPATSADPEFQISPDTDLSDGLDPFLVAPGTKSSPEGVKTVRKLTLNEVFDQYGRLIQMLGTNHRVPLPTGYTLPDGTPDAPYNYARVYDSTATETPKRGDVEVWEIANLTGDTHPMHFHLVNVQVLSRRTMATDANGVPLYTNGVPNFGTNPLRGPLPVERGWKETVHMNPGEVTTVAMKFDLPKVPFPVPPSPRTGGNEYVWHCHILEHEEHDMMRPLVVT